MDSQDTFSQDIFEFDDPNKVAEPVMRLRSPWKFNADLVQDHDVISEIADIADTTSIRLNLAATKLTRTRAGLLNPTGVSMTATQGESETAYAGRFLVAISTDGTNYVVEYQSSVNESAASYNVPAMHEGAFVVAVKCILYKADGFTERIATVIVPVEADVSSAPTYWGSLTTAPTTGVIAGDYYFDSNTTALGGGILRIYSNGMWPEYASGISNYTQSAAIALNDMMVWASTSGSTIAAAKAVIEAIVADSAFIAKLATQTQFSSALCDDGVTPRMSIDWDNALLMALSADQTQQIKLFNSILRSVEGSYALDHEGQSLVFRLASTLAEVAHIKYDPPSGLIQVGLGLSGMSPSSGLAVPVKFSGSWIFGSWGIASANGASVYANPDSHDTTILSNKTVLHVYANASTQLCERIEGTNGTLEAETVIDTTQSWTRAKVTTCGDGRVLALITYGSTIYKKVRSSSGVWGDAVAIWGTNTLSPVFDLDYSNYDGHIYAAFYLPGDTDHCVLVNATTPEGFIYWPSMNHIQNETAFTNNQFCLISQKLSVGCFIYSIDSSNHLTETTATTLSMGSASVIDSSITAITPSALIAPNYNTYLFFKNIGSSTGMALLKKTYAGVWDTSSTPVSGYFRPSVVITALGAIWCYSDNSGAQNKTIYSSSYSTIPQKTDFAPVGMGITEFGQNTNGYYFKIKTGTGTGILVCLYDDSTSYPTNQNPTGVDTVDVLYSFPSTFSSVLLIIPTSKPGAVNNSQRGVTVISGTLTSVTLRGFGVNNSQTIRMGYIAIGFYTE